MAVGFLEACGGVWSNALVAPASAITLQVAMKNICGASRTASSIDIIRLFK
jgi:hypothetical protein